MKPRKYNLNFRRPHLHVLPKKAPKIFFVDINVLLKSRNQGKQSVTWVWGQWNILNKDDFLFLTFKEILGEIEFIIWIFPFFGGGFWNKNNYKTEFKFGILISSLICIRKILVITKKLKILVFCGCCYFKFSFY